MNCVVVLIGIKLINVIYNTAIKLNIVSSV